MKEALQGNNSVNGKRDDLQRLGAVRIDKLFSIVSPGQHEVILDGRRLLITPNDQAHQNYLEALRGSGLNTLLGDEQLSDEDVIVGEISRDSRSLGQIAYSAESQGATPRGIFNLVGTRVSRLMHDKGVAPDPEDFELRKILLAKTSMELMIIPPMGFIGASQALKEQLVEALHQQLDPRYVRFDGPALETAFERGLG